MIKTRNRSHEVATATVGIAVATPWLERPSAFLTVGSRPQLCAVATSWLFFLPKYMLPKLDALYSQCTVSSSSHATHGHVANNAIVNRSERED